MQLRHSIILLAQCALFVTGCSHHPGSYNASSGYYSTYPEYYPGVNTYNNHYYGNYPPGHYHGKPPRPPGNWGYGYKPNYGNPNYGQPYYGNPNYGKPYGQPYYGNPQQYNQYNNNNNNYWQNNNPPQQNYQPWLHGDNRLDKRQYRQPPRDTYNDNRPWQGHHDDDRNDGGHDNDGHQGWGSWQGQNRRATRPDPAPEQPRIVPPRNNDNFNRDRENSHGRLFRPTQATPNMEAKPQMPPPRRETMPENRLPPRPAPQVVNRPSPQPVESFKAPIQRPARIEPTPVREALNPQPMRGGGGPAPNVVRQQMGENSSGASSRQQNNKRQGR